MITQNRLNAENAENAQIGRIYQRRGMCSIRRSDPRDQKNWLPRTEDMYPLCRRTHVGPDGLESDTYFLYMLNKSQQQAFVDVPERVLSIIFSDYHIVVEKFNMRASWTKLKFHTQIMQNPHSVNWRFSHHVRKLIT